MVESLQTGVWYRFPVETKRRDSYTKATMSMSRVFLFFKINRNAIVLSIYTRSV